jgi:hypothetical protein
MLLLLQSALMDLIGYIYRLPLSSIINKLFASGTMGLSPTRQLCHLYQCVCGMHAFLRAFFFFHKKNYLVLGIDWLLVHWYQILDKWRRHRGTKCTTFSWFNKWLGVWDLCERPA